MIKEIKPNVNQFKGKVNRRRMLPKTPLTKPITKPVIIAHPKPATCAPGTMYVANAITIPVTNKLMINLIADYFCVTIK